MRYKLTQAQKDRLAVATYGTGDYIYLEAARYINELEKEVEFLREENNWMQSELDFTLDCIERCSKICDNASGEYIRAVLSGDILSEESEEYEND